MSQKHLFPFYKSAQPVPIINRSERQQRILSWSHSSNQASIDIKYHAILKTDLPNGMKKGNVIDLQSKSIFTFDDQNIIIALTDISQMAHPFGAKLEFNSHFQSMLISP